MTAAFADRLVLIGMMGAGKSTVGRLAAQTLGWPFTDTDEEVERRTGKRVSELFESAGEARFRLEESTVLAELLEDDSPACVSVGGGAVLDPANRALLRRSGLVVWLRATPETLARRVGDGAGRPLISGRPLEALSEITRERCALYSETCEEVVDVDLLSAEAVAQRVAELVRVREQREQRHLGEEGSR